MIRHFNKKKLVTIVYMLLIALYDLDLYLDVDLDCPILEYIPLFPKELLELIFFSLILMIFNGLNKWHPISFANH